MMIKFIVAAATTVASSIESVDHGYAITQSLDSPPYMSCSHAVHIQSHQSCSALCEQRCHIIPSTLEAYRLAMDDPRSACLDSLLKECVVPIGGVQALWPELVESRTQHLDMYDYDGFMDRQNQEVKGVDHVNKIRTYHQHQRVLKYNKTEWTKATADASNLLWAAFKVQGPELIADDRSCAQVDILVHNPVDTSAASMVDWQQYFLHGINLGHSRDGPYAAHAGNRIDIGANARPGVTVDSLTPVLGAGSVRYTPSIAAYIQQWYMASEGTRDLVLGLTLHQEGDETKARTPSWDSYNVTLEVMVSWGWQAAPLSSYCATRSSSCKACTQELACHWCDLTNVDLSFAEAAWAGPGASSLTRCGMPPIQCHLLGGASYHSSCPLETWDALTG
eukprot:Blabericola_migrator_1__7226@NODE_366_length_9388_cov_56_375818_g293_i0_p3_GENE_NODE_366_length_9388_cov_56_375818_g293_i0NODE_366_length_9388_cov_56_375818_g293_i0_p3_ORF_typecomplete_len392_score46_10_NODE_366_length_9388_cov_56_375818_g293_i032774452